LEHHSQIKNYESTLNCKSNKLCILIVFLCAVIAVPSFSIKEDSKGYSRIKQKQS